MDNRIIEDLKMAEVNLAKIENAKSLIEDANNTLNNYKTDLKSKEEIKTSLDNVTKLANYEIQPAFVEETDDFITAKADLIVKDGRINISGTEAFGFTLTPGRWKELRTTALTDLLSESYKNVKRWANKLSDIFQRRWEEIMTSVETLEKRLSVLEEILIEVGDEVRPIKEVVLNEIISKTLSKNGKPLKGKLGDLLENEITYISTCLMFTQQEQVRFKNTVIRYFGNPKNTDITDIEKFIPKVYSLNSKTDTLGGEIIVKSTLPLLDDVSFEASTLSPKWIKENVETPEDGNTYTEGLGETGFNVITGSNTRPSKITMGVLSIEEIYQIKSVIEKIITLIKKNSSPDSSVNFNPDDVKDVIKTLKETNEDKNRAYQYGTITADFQYNTNTFITETNNYLIIIASHLITLLMTHLNCYQSTDE